MMKIGCIGAGNMAGAILRGLVGTGTDGSSLLVYDIDSQRQMELFNDCGVCMASSEEQVASDVQVLILAVKPQVYQTVLPRIRDAVRLSARIFANICCPMGCIWNAVWSMRAHRPALCMPRSSLIHSSRRRAIPLPIASGVT